MGDAHRKVQPFLLVRFLCGFTKKMNPVVGPGPDGSALQVFKIKIVGPDGFTAPLTQKKSHKKSPPEIRRAF
jgi:hypothetical protein